jgi:uncharacterized protein involved in oxidation of intracellular sulfur
VKIGIIITQTDPETVFNILKFATFAADEKDVVKIYLSGKGVELDQMEDSKYDVLGQAQRFLNSGGTLMACSDSLRLRKSIGSELCPLSTVNDMYEMIETSDKVLTF